MKWIIAVKLRDFDRKMYLENIEMGIKTGRRKWCVVKKFAHQFDDEEEAKRVARVHNAHVEPAE